MTCNLLTKVNGYRLPRQRRCCPQRRHRPWFGGQNRGTCPMCAYRPVATCSDGRISRCCWSRWVVTGRPTVVRRVRRRCRAWGRRGGSRGGPGAHRRRVGQVRQDARGRPPSIRLWCFTRGCVVSIYGVAWALDRVHGITGSAKVVLISLAEFANEQDVTWVSRERLMARAECSARALTGYFKELEACGALSREARYEWCTSESCSRTGEHKHRRGTVYRIHPELRIDMRAATGAGSAPVRKTLESQRKSHSGKSCVCEDTVAKPRRSQAQTPATITNRNEPPIEPPDPTQPSPASTRSGRVGCHP